MLAFLPLLFCFFCSVTARRYLDNWRAAVLFAAAMTAAVLTALTEILSLSQNFSFYPVVITWLLLTAAAGLTAFGLSIQTPPGPAVDFKTWSPRDKTLLGMIIFIGAASAVTAAVGIPDNWDSMTYHLARVEHWIQNRTVAFYPTNILRQLWCPPGAEFMIAHTRLLGGGPTSVNFIQWGAMAGSVTGVSLIAGQLGANRMGQLMAAIMAACLPIGILESVSTQTDYVCAFWLAVFVYFLIETQKRSSLIYYAATGVALGLAFLTKGYSYILALPFLGWLLMRDLRQRFFQGILGLLLIITLAVSLNMGHYWRNTQAFGSPFYTSDSLVPKSFDLRVLWGNILRNAALNLETPWISVNKDIEKTVTSAAQWIGADINDPRATAGDKFGMDKMNLTEDAGGSMLHFIFFGVVFIVCCLRPNLGRGLRLYMALVCCAAVLFCWVVRWQPWNTRFHLPLFILFCPAAGVFMQRIPVRKSVLLASLFFIVAWPYLFCNWDHRWFGRWSIWKNGSIEQCFRTNAVMEAPNKEAVSKVAALGCRQVGLVLGLNAWEYPFWMLLKNGAADKGLRIEHVQIINESASLPYPLGDFVPCAIIDEGGAFPSIVLAHGTYKNILGSDVYVRTKSF